MIFVKVPVPARYRNVLKVELSTIIVSNPEYLWTQKISLSQPLGVHPQLEHFCPALSHQSALGLAVEFSGHIVIALSAGLHSPMLSKKITQKQSKQKKHKTQMEGLRWRTEKNSSPHKSIYTKGN